MEGKFKKEGIPVFVSPVCATQLRRFPRVICGCRRWDPWPMQCRELCAVHGPCLPAKGPPSPCWETRLSTCFRWVTCPRSPQRAICSAHMGMGSCPVAGCVWTDQSSAPVTMKELSVSILATRGRGVWVSTFPRVRKPAAAWDFFLRTPSNPPQHSPPAAAHDAVSHSREYCSRLMRSGRFPERDPPWF